MFFSFFLPIMDYYCTHKITIVIGIFIITFNSFQNLKKLKYNSYDIQTINLSYSIIEYYSYDTIYKLIYHRQWFYIFHHILSILLLLLEIQFKTSNNITLNGIVFVLESSAICLTLYKNVSDILKKYFKIYYFIARIVVLNSLISYYVFIQNQITLFFIFQLTILIILYLGSIYGYFKLI